MTTIAPRRASRLSRFKRAIYRYWPLYLMLIPLMGYYIVYKFVPMAGLVISFKNFNIKKGIWASPWVDPWFKWFQYFFKSPSSGNIIGNTITLSLWKILTGMLPPILFALAISECRLKRFTRAVQTISYLPHFLSWVIVYGITLAMLSESSGIVNRWITTLGGQRIPFLTSNQYFMGVLVGTDLWKGLGWDAIVYLAAIMGIDPTLYEAATIDGCGRFRQIRYITFPCLKNIIVVLLILKVGNILDAGFTQVYTMMTDKVRTSGEIIDTWVFTEGLGKMRYSLSTAVGMLKSVISFFLVFSTNTLAKKWGQSLW